MVLTVGGHMNIKKQIIVLVSVLSILLCSLAISEPNQKYFDRYTPEVQNDFGVMYYHGDTFPQDSKKLFSGIKRQQKNSI